MTEQKTIRKKTTFQEVYIMKLINKEQVNAFEKAVNECSNSVWLVSDSGKW